MVHLGADPGEGLGQVLEAVAVRALDAPSGAQDGGAVGDVLAALCSRRAPIDGALVAKAVRRPGRAVEGRGHVSRRASRRCGRPRGSFYNQTMALAALDLADARAAGGPPDRRLVGTPCEVQGLRDEQMRPWPTGAHRVEAVSLTIALFCTKSFDYEALVVRELARTRGIDLDEVARIDVTRGRFTVDDVHGRRVVDERSGRSSARPSRAATQCADFAGRAADLSVGPWAPRTAGRPSSSARRGVARCSTSPARPSRSPTSTTPTRCSARRAERIDARRTLGGETSTPPPLFIEYGEHPTPQPLTRTPCRRRPLLSRARRRGVPARASGRTRPSS